jgi:predicted nuclease of predicted toxin-antitoxin system
MKFFFDNDLPEKLAQAMCLLDEDGEVEHLRKTFPQNTKDEVWLEYVGKEGLVLITRDQKIRKRPMELKEYNTHKVGAFILTGKNLGKWREIKQLICAWEEIRTLAADTQRPFAFEVPPRGRIKRLGL